MRNRTAIQFPAEFHLLAHSAEQQIRICHAHERKMQFQTRKDTLGIYIVHLFVVWHIFLRADTDWYTRYIFFKFVYDKDMTDRPKI